MDEAFPVQWDDPSDAALTWMWDGEHFPRALTPLSGDYVIMLGKGFAYLYERAGIPLHTGARVINGYPYWGVRWAIPESERPHVRTQVQAFLREQAKGTCKFWETTVLPAVLETCRWIQDAPIDSAPLTAVASLWDDAWNRMAHLFRFHSILGATQPLDDLADLYESLVPEAKPFEAMVLVQGLATEFQRVERDLYQLAECARSLPEVARAIVDSGPTHVLPALPHLEGGEEFLAAFQTFLAAHGHMGQAFEGDLQMPSWDDDPAAVFSQLRSRLLHPEEDPDARRRRLIAASDALADQTRGRLRDRPDDLRRFEAALAFARETAPLTQDHTYWLERMPHAHARRLALRTGTRLVAAEIIAEPNDVVFLHSSEIRKALLEPCDLRTVVSDRKATFSRQLAMRPPKYLGKAPDRSMPPNRFFGKIEQQSNPQRLRGTGASPGAARGTARVVLSPEDFGRVEAGDVLVCPASNPSWVPLFGIVAGLVTDIGGVNSHAAVIAREFGVPAVVGTGEATQRIRDGQQIEVDGTAGEVHLL